MLKVIIILYLLGAFLMKAIVDHAPKSHKKLECRGLASFLFVAFWPIPTVVVIVVLVVS